MGFLKHPVVTYARSGDVIEVKLKQGYTTFDTQEFDISTEKGQKRFFDYVVQKLGLNFKKYQKEKETDYY